MVLVPEEKWILKVCIILGKLLGVLGIYHEPDKYCWQWWSNIAYRLATLAFNVYAFNLQFPIQLVILKQRSLIPSGKILLENVLYWGCLYVSLATMLLRTQDLNFVLQKIRQFGAKNIPLNRILLHHIGLYLFLSLSQIIFNASSSSENEVLYINAAISYAFNKITVNFINFTFTAGLHILSAFFHQLNVELKRSTKDQRLFRIQLKLTQTRWSSLAALSAQLNRIFYLHIWFYSTTNLLEIIYSCNHLINIPSICGKNVSCILFNSIFFLNWLTGYILPEINMIYACSQLLKRSKQTGVIVSVLGMELETTRFTDDLSHFSHQVYENSVTITAGGCFDINWSLFASHIGNVTTFLLILTQFQQGGEETYYTGFV